MYSENMMQVEIKNILRNLGDISFMQPVFEAVNNSIEADATKITLLLKAEGNSLYTAENANDAKPLISRVTIKDNGCGFTKKNIESFCSYLSDYKADIGCKGVGRFTWLKIFKKVHISSKIKKDEGYDLLSFDFDIDSDWDMRTLQENIEHRSEDMEENETIITFDEIIDVEKSLPLDVEVIKETLLTNILPVLTIKKNSGMSIQITIEDEDTKKKAEILPETLPTLETKDFKIKETVTRDKKEIDFTLKYAFLKDGKRHRKNFYCANNRAVYEFSNVKDETVSLNLPDNDSSLMFLCSEYFDKLVAENRSFFNSISKIADMKAPLSWSDINRALKTQVSTVIENKYPAVVKDNEKKIEELKDENPHLTEYIDRQISNIGATQISEILKIAKKDFEEDKEEIEKKFSKALNKGKLSKAEKKEFIADTKQVSHFSALELAGYIKFRQKIIEAIKKCAADKEQEEKILHELFIKEGETTHNTHYLDSNLWLFDDKFMSFSYLASDVSYKKIAEELWGNQIEVQAVDKKKRPDLFVAFSDEEDAEHRDCVIVEFKAAGASISEKRKSISEIWDNMGAVKDNYSNIQNIYGYIVMEFEDTIDKSFERSGQFRPVFTRGNEKVYFGFNSGMNMSCFLISVSSLASDANARNKTFLDILRGKKKELQPKYDQETKS